MPARQHSPIKTHHICQEKPQREEMPRNKSGKDWPSSYRLRVYFTFPSSEILVRNHITFFSQLRHIIDCLSKWDTTVWSKTNRGYTGLVLPWLNDFCCFFDEAFQVSIKIGYKMSKLNKCIRAAPPCIPSPTTPNPVPDTFERRVSSHWAWKTHR